MSRLTIIRVLEQVIGRHIVPPSLLPGVTPRIASGQVRVSLPRITPCGAVVLLGQVTLVARLAIVRIIWRCVTPPVLLPGISSWVASG